MKLATLQAQLPDFEIRLLTLADQEALLELEQSNPRYHQYFSPEPLTMTEVQHDLTAHPDELAAAQTGFWFLLSTPFSSRFRCTQSVSTRTIFIRWITHGQ